MDRRVDLADDWYELLRGEFEEPYFESLMSFVDEQYRTQTIFPKRGDLFRAFELCSVEEVRVVIVGQDPYHGVGQADGLAFSVRPGVKLPPSLVNIFKEVEAEGYCDGRRDGDLREWAGQGVLLLNSVLTVREHQAASHKGVGWERFTDAVIRAIGGHKRGVVYVLWGGYAQDKADGIVTQDNLVLRGVHPSPLAAYRGFFGCGHFRMVNDYLGGAIVW